MEFDSTQPISYVPTSIIKRYGTSCSLAEVEAVKNRQDTTSRARIVDVR